MRLKESWSPFLQSLAWYGTFILPKHIYSEGDWSKNPANEKPIGSGAFKFVEWVKGERIVLAANPNYFGRGPFLDRLTFRVLKDPSTGVDLLLKGEVDFILPRPAAERIPEIQKTPGILVKTFAHTARYYVGFNLRRKPFDDVRVRQAINQAINRPLLVDRALLGYGAPASGFYTPAVPWAYNPASRVPAFDLAAAEKLLDQAGLPRGANGTRVTVTFLTFTPSPFKEIAETLREQLRAVGIIANVELLAPADWTKRVFEIKDFDLGMTDGTWGPDPDNLVLRFGSKGSNQFMGYASAEFDAAVAEGARLTQLEERAQAYFRAQEILARDLPLAPLVENVQFIITRDNISGMPLLEARGLVTFNDYRLVRIKR
jgi:peptide/nickel transport system substrate-binding protein